MLASAWRFSGSFAWRSFCPARANCSKTPPSSTPAAYDWSPVDLNDQPVPFSKFKGKTVFLNFWATWCGPCVREMPSIDKLARNPRLADKNIAFVCISTDTSTEMVREYVEGKGWPMTILRADNVPSVFYFDGIPATFVIAPDGRIAAFEVGAADWSEPHVVDFLEKLAAGHEQAMSPTAGANFLPQEDKTPVAAQADRVPWPLCNDRDPPAPTNPEFSKSGIGWSVSLLSNREGKLCGGVLCSWPKAQPIPGSGSCKRSFALAASATGPTVNFCSGLKAGMHRPKLLSRSWWHAMARWYLTCAAKFFATRMTSTMPSRRHS